MLDVQFHRQVLSLTSCFEEPVNWGVLERLGHVGAVSPRDVSHGVWRLSLEFELRTTSEYGYSRPTSTACGFCTIFPDRGDAF